jgi:hypothetical protein
LIESLDIASHEPRGDRVGQDTPSPKSFVDSYFLTFASCIFEKWDVHIAFTHDDPGIAFCAEDLVGADFGMADQGDLHGREIDRVGGRIQSLDDEP